MGNKKKKKGAEKTDIKKYPTNVENRIKKLASIQAEGDQALWKENDKKMEDFMRFGTVKKKDKLPKKVANRLENK